MRNNTISRITLDIPANTHKKLKSEAALRGQSMKEVVVELLDKYLITQKTKETKKQLKECPYDHTPNKTTIKAMQDAKKKKNVTKAKDITDLFKKLGI